MSEHTEQDQAESIMVPNYVRAFVVQQIKAVNKERREILHFITTPGVDRMGDIVDPGGADVTNFLKNPVVMANHDYGIDKVIGKAISVEIKADGISARTAFRDTPLARDAFALASEGLGGWSIGFRPVDYEPIKEAKRGLRFKKWELLEYSIVAIPANPEIVNNAVQRGWLHAENVAAFFIGTKGEEPPPAKAADTSPTVEVPSLSVADHPAILSAVDGARRRFEILEAAKQMQAAIERNAR